MASKTLKKFDDTVYVYNNVIDFITASVSILKNQCLDEVSLLGSNLCTLCIKYPNEETELVATAKINNEIKKLFILLNLIEKQFKYLKLGGGDDENIFDKVQKYRTCIKNKSEISQEEFVYLCNVHNLMEAIRKKSLLKQGKKADILDGIHDKLFAQDNFLQEIYLELQKLQKELPLFLKKAAIIHSVILDNYAINAIICISSIQLKGSRNILNRKDPQFQISITKGLNIALQNNCIGKENISVPKFIQIHKPLGYKPSKIVSPAPVCNNTVEITSDIGKNNMDNISTYCSDSESDKLAPMMSKVSPVAITANPACNNTIEITSDNVETNMADIKSMHCVGSDSSTSVLLNSKAETDLKVNEATVFDADEEVNKAEKDLKVNEATVFDADEEVNEATVLDADEEVSEATVSDAVEVANSILQLKYQLPESIEYDSLYDAQQIVLASKTGLVNKQELDKESFFLSISNVEDQSSKYDPENVSLNTALNNFASDLFEVFSDCMIAEDKMNLLVKCITSYIIKTNSDFNQLNIVWLIKKIGDCFYYNYVKEMSAYKENAEEVVEVNTSPTFAEIVERIEFPPLKPNFKNMTKEEIKNLTLIERLEKTRDNIAPNKFSNIDHNFRETLKNRIVPIVDKISSTLLTSLIKCGYELTGIDKSADFKEVMDRCNDDKNISSLCEVIQDLSIGLKYKTKQSYNYKTKTMNPVDKKKATLQILGERRSERERSKPKKLADEAEDKASKKITSNKRAKKQTNEKTVIVEESVLHDDKTIMETIFQKFDNCRLETMEKYQSNNLMFHSEMDYLIIIIYFIRHRLYKTNVKIDFILKYKDLALFLQIDDNSKQNKFEIINENYMTLFKVMCWVIDYYTADTNQPVKRNKTKDLAFNNDKEYAKLFNVQIKIKDLIAFIQSQVSDITNVVIKRNTNVILEFLENKVQTDISQALDKKTEKISSDIPEILKIDEIFFTLLAHIENYIKFCTKSYLSKVFVKGGGEESITSLQPMNNEEWKRALQSSVNLSINRDIAILKTFENDGKLYAMFMPEKPVELRNLTNESLNYFLQKIYEVLKSIDANTILAISTKLRTDYQDILQIIESIEEDIQYASRPFSKEEKEELFDLNTKSNYEVPFSKEEKEELFDLNTKSNYEVPLINQSTENLPRKRSMQEDICPQENFPFKKQKNENETNHIRKEYEAFLESNIRSETISTDILTYYQDRLCKRISSNMDMVNEVYEFNYILEFLKFKNIIDIVIKEGFKAKEEQNFQYLVSKLSVPISDNDIEIANQLELKGELYLSEFDFKGVVYSISFILIKCYAENLNKQFKFCIATNGGLATGFKNKDIVVSFRFAADTTSFSIFVFLTDTDILNKKLSRGTILIVNDDCKIFSHFKYYNIKIFE